VRRICLVAILLMLLVIGVPWAVNHRPNLVHSWYGLRVMWRGERRASLPVRPVGANIPGSIGPMDHSRRKWGFYFGTRWDFITWEDTGKPDYYLENVYVIVPDWFIVLAGILLLFCGTSWVLYRRRCRIGHCHTCGYDLTANTSGVCPECGSSVAGGKDVAK
jgi:hypothetical protein